MTEEGEYLIFQPLVNNSNEKKKEKIMKRVLTFGAKWS